MKYWISILFFMVLLACSNESDTISEASVTTTPPATSSPPASDNSDSQGSGTSDSTSSNSGTEDTSYPTIVKVVFNSNIHSSLPSEWTEQYNIILDTLDKRIPIFANFFEELDVYAWNSSTNKPYSAQIGDASGACICGNDQGRYMVLEIPEDEFNYESMHRYSVIAHEFFHAYQMSISENFNDSSFRIKWLNEGSAAVFESLYVWEHYDYNYFQNDQNQVDEEATTDPALFESYDSIGDSNYSSSVFMTLALVKELVKLGNTEEQAIRMIVKDFQEQNPNDDNWKEVFQQVLSFSVDAFYQSLAAYTADIETVIPSEGIQLQDVFEN